MRGFGNPHRALIVKKWLRTCYDTLDILCLQELQAYETKVSIHLQTVFLNGTVVQDSSESNRVGAAIVLAPHIVVLDQGSKGDGSFAWAKIDTPKGPVHVGSVYAPVERSRRLGLWNWMRDFFRPDDNWVLGGDWNMVEFHEDSSGTSSVIHGAEGRQWCSVQDKFDLLDLYLVASQRQGTWFS